MEGQIWWQLPGWFLLLLTLSGFLGLVAGAAKLFFPRVDREKERYYSIELARKIASFPQGLANRQSHPGSMVLRLELVADNEDMDESTLFFSYKHPDFWRLVRIKEFSVLNFDFQEQPIRGLERQDATTYLRLRDAKE